MSLQEERLRFGGGDSEGTASFLPSHLAPDTDPLSLRQSCDLSPVFLWVESWAEYSFICTLQYSLKLNRFPKCSQFHQRENKGHSVIWNLINTKIQTRTPGLNAFLSHSCPGDGRSYFNCGGRPSGLLKLPSGMHLVSIFQGSFPNAIFTLCIFKEWNYCWIYKERNRRTNFIHWNKRF